MANTLSLISIISYIAAGVFLVIAVIIWFVFNIPKVIGDLSGKNAKKSVERLRKENENTGRKTYSPGELNLSRGKLTESIDDKSSMYTDENDETGLLANNFKKHEMENNTVLLFDEGLTMMLNNGNQTESLAETELLKDVEENEENPFEIIEEIIFVHTKEEII